MDNEKNDLISKKVCYEAMLYYIKSYWGNSASNDLTNILSGSEYWKYTDEPAESALWKYWTEPFKKFNQVD